MTEQQRTFTAPAAGTYHVVSGQEPHLVQDCTEACRTWDGRFVAKTGEYRTVEFETTQWQTVAPRIWTELVGNPGNEIYHEGPEPIRVMVRKTFSN